MDDIRTLTEQAVRGVLTFKIDDSFDRDHFEAQATKAKVGMTYERDKMLAERIAEGNVIRVVHMITTDPEEKKQYLKSAAPRLFPVSKK